MHANTEPFVGPRPFEEADRDFFFGRSQEADELVSLITAHPAVLLYAQSGAGKTSLVRAGLIPLLINDEKFTVIPPMRVRENVAAGLKPANVANVYMFNALASISQPDAVPDLAGLTLSDYLTSRRPQQPDNGDCSPTIIIFDQFEEIFTLYPERWEDRRDFFMQIREALNRDSLLRVVFSMREDFIAEIDPYASLIPEKLRTRLRMERLRERTALGAVTQPLQRVQTAAGSKRFAAGVAEQLVRNLLQVKVKTPEGIKKVEGEFIEALQLQVVCQALWQNLQGDDLITLDDLDAYGDVDKALGQFYENALTRTLEKCDIKQGKLRQWFERALITPTGTRGTVFRGATETGGIPNPVVDELENQRIIRMELRGGAQWYELTHDRFVETVLTCNQNWLLLQPAADQVRQRLEEKAVDWDHNDRQDKYLMDNGELLLAERWMESSDAAEIEPSRELREYIIASKQLSTTKIERQKRIQQQARLARLSLAFSVVAAIGLLATIFGFWQWSRGKDAVARNQLLEAQRKEAEAQIQVGKLNAEVLVAKLDTSEATRRGYGFSRAGDLEKANEQFKKLLEKYTLQGDKELIGSTHLSLGDVAFKKADNKASTGQYDKALKSAVGKYDEALAIFQSDENFGNYAAQTYLKKAALQFAWGRQREEAGKSTEALKKYNDSFGYSGVAKNLFKNTKNDVGVREATNSYDIAKRFYDDLKSKVDAKNSSIAVNRP
jgi:tetratricopeptide (TPR) repeat protein